MELRQLVYFDAVVRCGGFTRAAEDLHIAQPAISAQLRRLEDELGVRLLTRTTRRVGLTDAGRLFLARARRVLGELDTARDEAADVAAVLRGRVVVGATQVLGGFDLPAALAGFAARHPGVRLTLRTGLVGSLLADLGRGDLDLVLGPVHDDLPAGYDAVPLVDDDLVLITPAGHRSAGATRVDLADLAGEPFVCLPADSGLRRFLEAAAADAGFRVDVPFEVPTARDIRAFVGAGLGVALIPASTAQEDGPPVDVHEVHPVPRHPPIGVVHRGEDHLSPAARALHVHLVHGAARSPQAGTTDG